MPRFFQLTYNGLDNVYLEYNLSGKVSGIYKNSSHTMPVAKYYYDEAGFRVRKEIFDISGVANETTTYVRDATGNILMTYLTPTAGSPQLKEINVYGASRVGMAEIASDGIIERFDYEIRDHLGNVRAVLTHDTDGDEEPEVLAYTDYYPFGMAMPGMNMQEGLGSGYRFG